MFDIAIQSRLVKAAVQEGIEILAEAHILARHDLGAAEAYVVELTDKTKSLLILTSEGQSLHLPAEFFSVLM